MVPNFPSFFQVFQVFLDSRFLSRNCVIWYSGKMHPINWIPLPTDLCNDCEPQLPTSTFRARDISHNFSNFFDCDRTQDFYRTLNSMVSRSENSSTEICSRSTNVILRLLISCLIFLEFELQVGLPIIFNSRIRIDFGMIIPFQKPGKQGFCTQRYDTAARSFSATDTGSVPKKQ